MPDDASVPGSAEPIPGIDSLIRRLQTGGSDLPPVPDRGSAEPIPGIDSLILRLRRPDWSDESRNRESRLADITSMHAQAGHSFEEARPDIEKLGVDPEQARPGFRLASERTKAAQMGSDWTTGRLDPSTLRNVAQVLPGFSSVLNWNDERQYGQAKERFARGQAEDDDYARIAQYEEMNKRKAAQPLGTSLRQTAMTLPGFAAEATAGGAAFRAARGVVGLGAEATSLGGRAAQLAGSTALTPALWAQQGARNLNEAKDRDSFLQQAQSYGSALTVGTIQNAILGKLAGEGGRELGGKIGTTLLRTGAGVLEQSTADMLTGAAGMTTGYGSLVDLAKGKYGDAGKELAVQAMTFGVFSALHQSPKAGTDAVKKVAERLDELKKADVPLDAAVAIVKKELPELTPPVDPAAWTEAHAPGALEPGSLAGPAPAPGVTVNPGGSPAQPAATPVGPPPEPQTPRQRADSLFEGYKQVQSRLAAAEGQVRALGNQLGLYSGGKKGLPPRNPGTDELLVGASADKIKAYRAAWEELADAQRHDRTLLPELAKARDEALKWEASQPKAGVSKAGKPAYTPVNWWRPASKETVMEGAYTPDSGTKAKGWKLHLATDRQEEVSKELQDIGLTHKVGHGGDEGKEITVYVGSRDAAERAAKLINERAGHLLDEPHGDSLQDDISFGGKVMGRFEVHREKSLQGDVFHQYGGRGISFLEKDQDFWNKPPFEEAYARADKALREKYGEFYTGKPPSEPPAAPAGETPSKTRRPVGYTTEKGSTYEVHPDGTTTRTKALRDAPGHEGDFGLKEKSEKTVYVDTAIAGALTAAGLHGLGPKGARLAIDGDRATFFTWNEKEGRWGSTLSGRNVPISHEPQIGLSPLELWKRADDFFGYEAYKKQHAGSKITSIKHEEPPPAPETPPAAPPEPSRLSAKDISRPDASAKEGPKTAEAARVHPEPSRKGVADHVRDFDDLVERMESGEDVDPEAFARVKDAVFDAAGLTERESRVLTRLLDPHATLDSVAEDLAQFEGKDRPLSAERIRQIAARARDKLGVKKTIAEINGEHREAARQARLKQASEVGTEVAGKPSPRQVRADAIERRMNDITNTIEQERADGRLTPQREEELYRQLLGLYGGHQEEGQGRRNASQAGQSAGGVQPASLRRQEPGGVPGGGEATANPVADAGGGAAQAAPDAGNAQGAGADAGRPAGGTPAPASGRSPSGHVIDPVTKAAPGDPIPGVTRGANASTPLTQEAIDKAILTGAYGPDGGHAMGAAPLGFTTPKTPAEARIEDGVAAQWRFLNNAEASLGGVIAPRISQLNDAAGRAAARLGAVPDKLARTVQFFNNELYDHLAERARVEVEEKLRSIGSTDKPIKEEIENAVFQTADDYGSIMNELRMRKKRAYWQAQEQELLERAARSLDSDERMELRRLAHEAADTAAETRTMIGSKFYDEADFQRKLASPGFQDFKAWYGQKGGVHEKLEELYRDYHNMSDDDPIGSISQIDGLVFHAKAIREGEELPDKDRLFGGGNRKGNLLNPRLKKLGASYGYTGASEAYDTNLFRIIEHSFAQRMQNVEQVRFIRAGLNAKTEDGQPVMYPLTPGAELARGYRTLTTKRLPPEIRTGYPAGTEINVAVHPEAYTETYRLMNLDNVGLAQQVGNVIGKVSDIATAINVYGVAEGMGHCLGNMLKVFSKAGVRSLPDMVRNIRDVFFQKRQTLLELLDHAAEGRLKPQHAETSLDRKGLFGGGRYDPTRYALDLQRATIGKFMDRFDDALRLTMAHAFDRIAAANPTVIGTEKAKTDFINQLGNYQKNTQNYAVSLLRDLRIGPFATAAANNVIQSMRSVFLGRGIRTTDWKTQFKLRGEIGLQVAGVLGTGFLVNYLLHQRVDGDENTPLGAVKLPLGLGYIDLLALANMRRGSQTIGLQSVIEGTRYGGKGAAPSTMASNAAEQIAKTTIHPAAGPAVNTALTATMGFDAGFRMMVPRKEEHDFGAKLQAALMNLSPTGEAILNQIGVKTHPGKREEEAKIITKALGLNQIFKQSSRPPGRPLPTN